MVTSVRTAHHRTGQRGHQPPASADGTVQPAPLITISRSRLYAPLTVAVAYLGGTYLLFLVIGQVGAVRNLGQLTAFIAATIGALVLGYVLKLRAYDRTVPPVDLVAGETRSVQQWIVLSALHYSVFGIASLMAYGASSPAAVLTAITHPGAAYFAKFRIYELQQATGERDLAIQLLTVLAVLSTPLIPMAVLYWRDISRSVRLFAVSGVALYAAFFLFIGTLKGIADVLVFAAAACLVLTKGIWRRGRRRLPRGRLFIVGTLLAVTVGSYIAFNQSQRLVLSGGGARFEPNPVVQTLTNEQFARGVAVLGFYPTHGYQGLAYNLQTPFKWTAGLGSSRALDGYWVQYVGGESQLENTYPARTQLRTGWPAGRYWTTIYPWLASDLTFLGVIFFMGAMGWWMARFWYEAAFRRSRLALLLFCQMMLLITYVPANNQIGAGRVSLIALMTLFAAYTVNRLSIRMRRQ